MTHYAKASDLLPASKDDFLNGLTPALMSHDMDADRLAGCPHTDIPGTDLAIVARYRPPTDGNISALVNNAVAQMYNLTGGEIIHRASAALSKDSYTMDSLGNMLSTLTGDHKMAMCDPTVLVLRSNMTEFGACEIANPAAQKEAQERLGGDYFILPSSKYEVLLVPKGKGLDADCLSQMVREVNDGVVARNDRLSDNVYQYSGDTLSITKASSTHEKSVDTSHGHDKEHEHQKHRRAV